MPKIISLGDINGIASPGVYEPSSNQIPPPSTGKRWAAFAIAPGSLVDVVTVDGQLLAPGRILPVLTPAPKAAAVRGPRTGGLFARDVNVRCELIGWECDETPFNPGPRAPTMVSFTTDLNGQVAYTRVLRLPFAGRRMASISIEQFGTVGQTTQYIVQGVKYLNRDFSLRLGDIFTEPHIVQLQGTTTVGTTPLTSNGDRPSDIFYIGGTDSQEDFDEIELWMRQGGAGGNADIYVHAEAWGEHG